MSTVGKHKKKRVLDIGESVRLVFKVTARHLDDARGKIIGRQGELFKVKAMVKGKTKYVDTDAEHLMLESK